METYKKYYLDHVRENSEKMQKTTLFSGEHLMLGLNCLLPGQEHRLHSHMEQDKFYLVLEGEGTFQVAEETMTAGEGEIIWAPAGIIHAVLNATTERLVLLVGIAPGPKE